MRRLGHSASDRIIVLHADDLGMCHATVAAWASISSNGIGYSGSAMTPCSWWPAVADLCRRRALDVGVHLTLTSEWPSYRWGPITGSAALPFCGPSFYFPHDAGGLQSGAIPQRALRAELAAQIRRARESGVDVSHLDTHMFALIHPALMSSYVDVASEFELPCFVPPEAARWLSPEQREGRSAVLFDGWTGFPLDDASGRLELGKRLLDAAPKGLTYWLSHPAADSEELRAVASDWRARVADYELAMDERWRRAIEAAGLKVVTMREIRDALFDDQCFRPQVMSPSPRA